MKYKIGFITHSAKTKHRFPKLAESQGCNLIYMHGELEPATDVALELENQHQVDAIICSPFTYRQIIKHMRIPVVPLYLENYTLLISISKALRYGRRIALMQFFNSDAVYDLETIAGILDCSVEHFLIHSADELESTVSSIQQQGFDVLLTTLQYICDFSEGLGLPTVLVEIQEQEIISAVNQAKSLIEIANRSLAQAKFFEAIMNVSEDGIIGVDEKGRIEFINITAARLLNIQYNSNRKYNLEELSKQHSLLQQISSAPSRLEILKNDETPLLLDRQDIKNEREQLVGYVLRITHINKLRDKEMHARRIISDNNFAAQHSFSDIKGVSDAMTSCINIAQKYALSKSNIIMNGESGTGKELFAQSIHNFSAMSDGPFLAINCASFTESLLESELFGYEEGSFTGATKGGKAGVFELAHNGTLFLDEIGEMPFHLQAKLLRVLEDRYVRRIGGSKNIHVNIRIISATNRNLFDDVKKNRFRADLYFRLNVLNLKIPPLRERKSDIPILAKYFLRQISLQENISTSLPDKIMSTLIQYNWPGNVRELRNFIEKIVVLSRGGELSHHINKRDISDLLEYAVHDAIEPENGNYITVEIASLKEMENELIAKVYSKLGEDREKLHNTLKISQTTIWRRLKEIESEQHSLE